ncbi:MAG: hypothetical protein II913_01685 [Elusimicrobiaceae bacterium]|nr:hypothetical protein [Elusimicrobiaceae bacterium]
MKTLFKPTSYKKGAALAIGATFVWKTISFANALLLALYFGASRQTDVYFYLIILTGVGVAFLQRLNQTVLIPEAMFLTQQDKTTGQKFATMWLYIYVALGIVVCLISVGCPEQIWRVLSRFGEKLLAHDRALLMWALWVFALQIITYYLIAVAEMYKFFKTAWLGVLNAICPLTALLLFGSHVGIISMLYGFFIADVLQIIILLTLLKTQMNWTFRPAWISLRTRTRQNMLTGQTLAVLDVVNSWLPLYLMSGMGAGLVSALNYCKQLTDSTTEVFTARVANVAKIEITEQIAKKELGKANVSFVSYSYILLVILAPLVVFSCYFAPYIVELFFKRGQFTAQAAHDTILFLRPMLFVLLLSVPGYLQNSALAAGQKIKDWFPYALTSGLVFTAMMWFFIPKQGAFVYPYLIGAGLVVGFILNAFLFKKHLNFMQYFQPLRLVARFTALAVIALVPAALLSCVLAKNCWIQIFGCGCVFVAAYAGILYLAKDMWQLRQFFRNNF